MICTTFIHYVVAAAAIFDALEVELLVDGADGAGGGGLDNSWIMQFLNGIHPNAEWRLLYV